MHFHKWIEFKDDNNMYYRFCIRCRKWQKLYGMYFGECPNKPDIKSLVVVDNEAEEWELLKI